MLEGAVSRIVHFCRQIVYPGLEPDACSSNRLAWCSQIPPIKQSCTHVVNMSNTVIILVLLKKFNSRIFEFYVSRNLNLCTV